MEKRHHFSNESKLQFQTFVLTVQLQNVNFNQMTRLFLISSRMNERYK